MTRRQEADLVASRYTVMRVLNAEIYENVDGVCDTILAKLEGERS